MTLTKKQLDIIDEWFKNGGDESAVLLKYNISQKIWKCWLADKDFNVAVADKMKATKRQGQILIAQYTPMAAAKLVQLCGSEKEETSRKACLDILSAQNEPAEEPAERAETGMLDDETAAKILAVLAEGRCER